MSKGLKRQESQLHKRVPEGYRVSFAHWRFIKGTNIPKSGPLSRHKFNPVLADRSKEDGQFKSDALRLHHPTERGGLTRCEILVSQMDENDEIAGWLIHAEGEAECGFGDHFNYRLGRVISLGRALKVLDG